VRRVSISYFVGLAMTASVPAIASAQTSVPSTSPRPVAVAGDDDAGRTDLIDLYRLWRKKPPQSGEQHSAWTIVPILSAKPSSGVKFGAGADVEFKLGDPARTRFSTLTTSLAFSTHKQVSASENLRLYAGHNRWMIEGQNHFNGKSSDNVTLGTSSAAEIFPDIRYYSLQFIDTYYYRVRPSLYVGGGLVFQRQLEIEPFPSDSPDWEASPFRDYSAAHGFDPGKQTSAGTRVALLFDNRDNQNDAIRGWYGLASYRTSFEGFLGGDSSWQEVTTDVRTYRALTADKRHKLAFWAIGNFVTSGTAPYLALPASGGDDLGRSTRGYPEGRFRGERLIYVEAEYRGLVTRNGLLGMTAFVNVTTMSNNATGEQLFDAAAFGAGAGLRLLVHKQSRSNLCIDVAFGGDGSHGLYIGFRDAF
jgi:hypothetical protein